MSCPTSVNCQPYDFKFIHIGTKLGLLHDPPGVKKGQIFTMLPVSVRNVSLYSKVLYSIVFISDKNGANEKEPDKDISIRITL